MEMNDYFLVKNLFNYEKVIPPPKNLPSNLKTVYVTDTLENVMLAKDLGWNSIKLITGYEHIVDSFERRKLVALINSFPLKVVPELINPRYVFICDSNINDLWVKYGEFVDNCTDKHALYVTSGFYRGDRNNMEIECQHSCKTPRWSYNHNGIRTSTDRYKQDLNENNIDYMGLSVVSAKYIGWNVNHPKYDELSNVLYNEYLVNLQGNIILTYISGLYSEFVYNYHTNDYSGASVNQHNFQS